MPGPFPRANSKTANLRSKRPGANFTRKPDSRPQASSSNWAKSPSPAENACSRGLLRATATRRNWSATPASSNGRETPAGRSKSRRSTAAPGFLCPARAKKSSAARKSFSTAWPPGSRQNRTAESELIAEQQPKRTRFLEGHRQPRGEPGRAQIRFLYLVSGVGHIHRVYGAGKNSQARAEPAGGAHIAVQNILGAVAVPRIAADGGGNHDRTLRQARHQQLPRKRQAVQIDRRGRQLNPPGQPIGAAQLARESTIEIVSRARVDQRVGIEPKRADDARIVLHRAVPGIGGSPGVFGRERSLKEQLPPTNPQRGGHPRGFKAQIRRIGEQISILAEGRRILRVNRDRLFSHRIEIRDRGVGGKGNAGIRQGDAALIVAPVELRDKTHAGRGGELSRQIELIGVGALERRRNRGVGAAEARQQRPGLGRRASAKPLVYHPAEAAGIAEIEVTRGQGRIGPEVGAAQHHAARRTPGKGRARGDAVPGNRRAAGEVGEHAGGNRKVFGDAGAVGRVGGERPDGFRSE